MNANLEKRQIMFRLLSVVLALSFVPPVEVAAADLEGKACVENGDTIYIDGRRGKRSCQGGTAVRLRGIDAPELGQTCKHSNGRYFLCGRYAASFLLERLMKQKVRCKGKTKNKQGLVLATCFVGRTNLNMMMVDQGWAVADPSTSLKYMSHQERAEAGKRGIWGMTFDHPAEWRRKNPR